ncbi:MAG: EI24 domain-containing protein [Aquabacterium sp.]
MREVLDAFWRAAAYCLHPRVIGLSVLPLLVGVGLAWLLGWLYWEAAVAGVRATLEGWSLVDAALRWLEGLLGASFRSVLAPLVVVMLALPVIVVLSLLLVALLMVPALVRLVARRRFAALEQRQGAGWMLSALWGLGCTLLALVALVVTMPLWFVPPLMLVLPPLIWGWLTYRVMAFDALGSHASADERRALMRQHRLPLLTMGIICGYLGAAPGLLWAFSALALVFAPLLIAASIWLYTLVFAFSALWFTHYGLAALARLRGQVPTPEPGESTAAPAAAAPATTAPHRLPGV